MYQFVEPPVVVGDSAQLNAGKNNNPVANFRECLDRLTVIVLDRKDEE
jgi:hypothetical protein